MPDNQQTNSRWHSAGFTDTVIVFVHGLFSSPVHCWTNQNGTYWPTLVSEDDTFEGASVFLAGYYTDVDAGRYDFAQCAREVADALKHERINGRVPMDYGRIVFVAHSLGGVVVRRLLEENSQDFADKQIGLALMASPSGGSAYASFFGGLSRIYGHKAALDLRPQTQALEDLDHRFRGVLENRRINIIGTEACEHQGILRWKWLPIRLPLVVSSESSSKYFGTPKIIRGTDHASIVKPDGLRHAAHDFLRNYFRSNWARSRSAADSVQSQPEAVSPSEVLFPVYRSAANAYCIFRELDLVLKNRLALKSVWVHGGSGLGKTTVVKRYLDENGLKPLELTFGSTDTFTAESFRRELAETISVRNALPTQLSHAGVVAALSKYFGRQGVVLFIDEIPIGGMSEESERQLLISISALLDAVQKTGGAQLRVVLCSIGRPRLHLAGQKCIEQIELTPAELWTFEELKQLSETIRNALPELQSSVAVEDQMISAALGSPRVVKEFYRRRILVGQGTETGLQSLHVVLNTLGMKPGELT